MLEPQPISRPFFQFRLPSISCPSITCPSIQLPPIIFKLPSIAREVVLSLLPSIAALALAILVAYSLRPYCDEPSPRCRACPDKATCTWNKVVCNKGYRLIGGWPLPARCELDGAMCLAHLSELAMEQLCLDPWSNLGTPKGGADCKYCRVRIEQSEADKIGCPLDSINALIDGGSIALYDRETYLIPTERALLASSLPCRLKYYAAIYSREFSLLGILFFVVIYLYATIKNAILITEQVCDNKKGNGYYKGNSNRLLWSCMARQVNSLSEAALSLVTAQRERKVSI